MNKKTRIFSLTPKEALAAGAFIGVILYLMVAILLSGCAKKETPPVPVPVLQILPQTHFDAAAVVPLVTPSITTAQTDNQHAADSAQKTYQGVVQLTPTNVESQRDVVGNWAKSTLQFIAQVGADLADAQAKSSANTAAVTILSGQLVSARQLTLDREAQMKQMAIDANKALAAKQAEVDTVTAENANLKSDEAKKDRAASRTMAIGTCSVGGLIFIGGVFAFFFIPTPKTLGICLAAAGGVVFSAGMACLWYGKEVGMVGFAIGLVTMAGGVWASLHYKNLQVNSTIKDGESIAEVLQHLLTFGHANTATNIHQLVTNTVTPGAANMIAAVAPAALPPTSTGVVTA